MNFEEFLNRGANKQEQPPEEANEIAEVDDEAIAESIRSIIEIRLSTTTVPSSILSCSAIALILS